jgi:putative transposase
VAKKRLGPDQIVTKLRQIEVLQGRSKRIAAACKEAGTTEQSYYLYERLSRCKAISI